MFPPSRLLTGTPDPGPGEPGPALVITPSSSLPLAAGLPSSPPARLARALSPGQRHAGDCACTGKDELLEALLAFQHAMDELQQLLGRVQDYREHLDSTPARRSPPGDSPAGRAGPARPAAQPRADTGLRPAPGVDRPLPTMPPEVPAASSDAGIPAPRPAKEGAGLPESKAEARPLSTDRTMRGARPAKRKTAPGGFEGDGQYTLPGASGPCRVTRRGSRLLGVFEREQPFLWEHWLDQGVPSTG